MMWAGFPQNLTQAEPQKHVVGVSVVITAREAWGEIGYILSE